MDVFNLEWHISDRYRKLQMSVIFEDILYDWNFRCTGICLKWKCAPSVLQNLSWDYSGSQIQYKGLIRADYAPLWFLTGLLFEKILSDNS